MLTKLNYLKNPRYFDQPNLNPASIEFLASCKPPGLPAALPATKFQLTSRQGIIFVLEPSEVIFSNYEVANVYEKTIRIRNVTNIVRTLRTLPPKSQYFHMSLLRYPTHSGRIAPGMAAEVTIRFTPDSLADYDDALVIDTPGCMGMHLPLLARRDAPVLTLEEVSLTMVAVVSFSRNTMISLELDG